MQQKEKSTKSQKITLLELNAKVGDIARRVHYTGESVIVTANRKPLVAIVPVSNGKEAQK